MRKTSFVRPLYVCLLFVSVLYFPWWIVVSLALFGATVFDHWYECMVAGVCMDVLYGTHGTTPVSIPILFTLIGVVFYGINVLFKNLIRV